MLYFLNQYENMKLGLHIFSLLPENRSLVKLPSFYRELLTAWRKLTNGHIRPPVNRKYILMQPIFHNSLIRNKLQNSLLNRIFIHGEIVSVRDLMYEMIPKHMPAEYIHESIQMLHPNDVIRLKDVETYITIILQALPADWLQTIYSSDIG